MKTITFLVILSLLSPFYALSIVSMSIPSANPLVEIDNLSEIDGPAMVLIRDNHACIHPLEENSNLIPPFLSFSNQDIDSSFQVKQNLPLCNVEDLEIAQRLAESPLLDKHGGVQVAVLPLAGVLGNLVRVLGNGAFCMMGGFGGTVIARHNIENDPSFLDRSVFKNSDFWLASTMFFLVFSRLYFKGSFRISRYVGLAGMCFSGFGALFYYGRHNYLKDNESEDTAK